MTSFAFILGVVPLVVAKGAGSEMRAGLGVAVFSGMLGVTLFGLIFTPVFFVFIRRLSGQKPAATAQTAKAGDGSAVSDEVVIASAKTPDHSIKL